MDSLSFLKFGGLVFAAVMAILMTVTPTRRERRRRQMNAWGWVSLGLILTSITLSILVELKQSEHYQLNMKLLQGEIAKLRSTNEVSARELSERLQKALGELALADREPSRKLTDEKIRSLEKHISEYAATLAKDSPQRLQELARAREVYAAEKLTAQQQELRRQLEASQKAYPLYSFLVRYTQELVRKYAATSGIPVEVPEFDLPANMYKARTNCVIKVGSNAVWTIACQCDSPATGPYMLATFTDGRKKPSGSLQVDTYPGQSSYKIRYTPVIADGTQIAYSRRPMDDFEAQLRADLDRIVANQLTYALEAGL